MTTSSTRPSYSMSDSATSVTHKAGLAPGTLIHIGEVLDKTTRVSVIDYNTDRLEEHLVESIDELLKYKTSDTTTWIHVDGLADVEIIEQIGAAFGIHQLTLEDIIHTSQRPKFEEYDDYLYIVLKHLEADDEFGLFYEQISILVLDNIVITFKEKSGELFQPILKRIKNTKWRFRGLGADYLAYAIIDTIVDQYFFLMDALDVATTSLEDTLLTSEPTQASLQAIQGYKRKLINIKRYIAPTREMMSEILHSESGLIEEKTRIYFKDVSDHMLRVAESIDSYREILSSLLDIYISSMSNKMNEVMKVLTVFASIFIPLTFLSGIYGMNFEYMPELKWHWSYPALWGVFIVIVVLLLAYFRKKKWF